MICNFRPDVRPDVRPAPVDTGARCLSAGPTHPGREKHHADALSREGTLLTIDLFATRDNNKLPLFCSPMPDERALGADGLSQSWDNLFLYAFPPYSLIPSLLRKLDESRNVELILVAPNWPAQMWFPWLLESLVELPRALPQFPALLKQGSSFHNSLPMLSLHAWRLSTVASRRRGFREQQPNVCREPSKGLRRDYTSQSGSTSPLGVCCVPLCVRCDNTRV